MRNSWQKSQKFPIYKSGNDFYKPAHIIKNSDMCTLYEFFNPKENQVCITGSTSICGDNIPRLLEALGYDVKWENNKESWTVRIPEEFRIRDVEVIETRRW